MTVLVGVTSSIAIVYQAALALAATPGQIASWMLALGLGVGAPGVVLSLVYRQPIVFAWSTPGAALIAVSGSNYSLPLATGAFIFCGAMFVAYLIGRRASRRYTVLAVLAVGVAIAGARRTIDLDALRWGLAVPEWVSPQWSLGALIGLGVPLWLVTMASQNLPGAAAIRAHGYDAPISPLITWSGVMTTGRS